MSKHSVEEMKLDVICTLLRGKWQKEEKPVVLSDIEKIIMYKEKVPCEICGDSSAQLLLIFKRVVFCCDACFAKVTARQQQLGIFPEEPLDDFDRF